MSYVPVTELKIGLNLNEKVVPVGRLAIRNQKIYFEYDAQFLKTGLEISPFHLPLRPGVKTCDSHLFDGLPGVFNDSLPDGWGRLLLDRYVRTQGILADQLTVLDRLAYVGKQGMGALIYEPELTNHILPSALNLDQLSSNIQHFLKGNAIEILSELLIINGSSAGAKPKAMIGVDQNYQHIIHGTEILPKAYEPWLVKFANMADGVDAGAIEYVYGLMAKKAGIIMTDIHLFPAKENSGYFATKRFDRNQTTRLHIHTVCGLLHSDFRAPSLDYKDLMALTARLTGDIKQVERMFRLAVFNVLAHNRDDHAKNFSFMLDQTGKWQLAPAYDLNFSAGPFGEQSMMVMGEGKNPTIHHLIQLGLQAKLNSKRVNGILLQTKEALSYWPILAKKYGVRSENIQLIQERIAVLLKY